MSNVPPSPPADAQGSSTRPYLIRALHDWCTDNGFTPYLAVFVDRSVQVPFEYVKNNEIVLNVGFEATSGLKLGNDFIEFKARFGGVAREILVPVDHVVAIYARENGQGMAFPMPTAPSEEAGEEAAAPAAERGTGLRLASVEPEADRASEDENDGDEPPPSAPTPRPALKRIK
ncbi:ClpXP protease specificity-enhancing factor [Ideonella sp. B508-1]|uniref:ClpXP protease specificity-enhancing factor n=1 Tax=Ideonella sp. B508-1 TaxID=137716 RepID=UPI0003B3C5FE|nr:ClpXP protease specificity-enhancing factor [Ideonella sp. B508-1]